MTERAVRCEFHNVSSDLTNILSSSVNVPTSFDSTNKKLTLSCSLPTARQIRSQLADSFFQHPQIWFSAELPSESGNNRSKLDTISYVYFGSLLSVNQFVIHAPSIDDESQWNVEIENKMLIIKSFHNNQKQLRFRLAIPMKYVNKEVLVIDGEDYAEIIFSVQTMTIDVQIDAKRRLFSNSSIVESLGLCSDILISVSSKSKADAFLDLLRLKFQCQIFYTMLSVQRFQDCTWSISNLNQYQTIDGRYSIEILHSLGHVFDDKYLTNSNLQNEMINLAQDDIQRFYQLTLRACDALRKQHWLDLTTIFNRKNFTALRKQTQDKDYHVAVVHLTPTRLFVMPRERTKGHRALRHPCFNGVNDFCLVYLKPDGNELYFNDHTDLRAHFQHIFETGIELVGERFFLFGASNSQIQDCSYWFVRASSLDEIAQKRQQLGRFDRIQNLGTYVARIGLWFSKSDPTKIKLIYCSNAIEYDKCVRQGEACVTVIEDIERNNQCFTDGNGLISKGLAYRVAQNINCLSNHQQEVIFPSAYQIRMAGCKGLVIIDPQSTMDQFYIKVRPSMVKFECDEWILDICNYSRPTPTRLNNQIILLMSDLGVSDTTFLRLQQQWFNNKHLASIKRKPIDLLKNKIPLPVNESRFSFGCALESQLQPGTCFIRYQMLQDNGRPLPNSRFECVRGPVIVTKNPCLYAGDMLELWAVDLPELHCLTDVIVFSTQGDRPDYNKIAGSDLDGDGYFIYWGQQLRLCRKVEPLDYTPEPKRIHSTVISPCDVITQSLLSLGATNSGEIFNLHAAVVDRNEERHEQRTCQTLAIELARMFSSAIDASKTGYVIDKQRVQEIRRDFGKEFPDFLMKFGKSYKSQSIAGKLYRNAKLFEKNDINGLTAAFAQLSIENDGLGPTTNVNANIDPPIMASIPARKSTSIHPGSPLPPSSPVVINPKTTNEEKIVSDHCMPPQYLIIDGMLSSSSNIRLCSSAKPFYSEHLDIIRLHIELTPIGSKPNSPSLSSILFDRFSSIEYPHDHTDPFEMVVSFGHLYFLQYQNVHLSETIESLINKHFLPTLIDTFLPSTILEPIEVSKENAQWSLQQIFYRSNQRIKRDYIEQTNNEIVVLLFPWLKMNLIKHNREIVLICKNTHSNTEIAIHFDKHGLIKYIHHSPKIRFKCFHQQHSPHRPDLLYELRSHSIYTDNQRSLIFQHQTLLDPTHPLSLPFHSHIIPMLSYSIITNIFEHDDIQIHSIRIHPLHYQNDDFYTVRSTLGYFEQNEQHSLELHVKINSNEKPNRDQLRRTMAMAIELSQMLD